MTRRKYTKVQVKLIADANRRRLGYDAAGHRPIDFSSCSFWFVWVAVITLISLPFIAPIIFKLIEKLIQ